MTVTWMQIVWIPWAHIPVTVELDIPETDKLAMVRNLPINQPTNKHLMLMMNLLEMALYFRQPWDFSCIDALRKACNEPLLFSETANREKINPCSAVVYNRANINHPEAENESESVQSKINRLSIKTFCEEFKFFTSTWQFLLHKTREHAVGNSPAIEGQTANILTSRTGLWARCSTSLLEFEKYLMSLLVGTKRHVIPATKFKFFTKTFCAYLKFSTDCSQSSCMLLFQFRWTGQFNGGSTFNP